MFRGFLLKTLTIISALNIDIHKYIYFKRIGGTEGGNESLVVIKIK